MKGERKERLYIVSERLIGEAYYAVRAHNKGEAMAKVRANEAGGMLDNRIDHTGRGHVRRATKWEGGDA